MPLHTLLQKRAAENRPIRVGVIGAGKFGSMYLAQARRTAGVHIMALAELSPARAKDALRRVGWPDAQFDAASFEDAVRTGKTFIPEDSHGLVAADGMEVVIDATGVPAMGIRHALLAAQYGRHIVMVNVEADVLAGPLLARKVEAGGGVYTLAYGDQPALIAEIVDWARAAGFDVVSAGKGTKYLPHYHASTPDTVWQHYGQSLTPEEADAAGLNSQMFNSFLDGTKSGIEMAAVANATGLTPAPDGLTFPPCGTHDLTHVMRPKAEGGLLHHKGQVEVISSSERDAREVVNDLRWGVFATLEAPDDYVRECFAQYGLTQSADGRYAAMYKPYHLIGLELGISVANAALRGESTGAPDDWRGDVVATAKRDLKEGEILDGEGGYTVWGKLMPAEASLRIGGLPIGLAHGVKLKRHIPQGQHIVWADVDVDETAEAYRVRREMEEAFAIPNVARPAAE
ncbi:MAG: SAF domain-containing protein [Rickettsiales bacterium]